MSETTRILAGAVMSIAAIAGPAQLAAQRAADPELVEAREAYLASEDELNQVLAKLEALRLASRETLTDTLQVSDWTILFAPNALTTRNRARLETELAGIDADLRARFGSAVDALRPGAPWELRRHTRERGSMAYSLGSARVERHVMPWQTSVSWTGPVDTRRVRQLAYASAAQWQLGGPGTSETLREYASDLVTLDLESAIYVRAARELALGRSEIGRRCKEGAVGACRVALQAKSTVPRIEMWYRPEDYRDVVARSRPSRAVRDSAFNRKRSACVATGDMELCREIVGRISVPFPWRREVRASFASFALASGGADGLARLSGARDRLADDPYALLVHVSGLPEEQLLARWQQHVVTAASATTQTPTFPLVLTAGFWTGLCLLGATLRRPT